LGLQYYSFIVTQISNDSIAVREIRILQVTCASHQWMIQRCDKNQGEIYTTVNSDNQCTLMVNTC